MYLSLIQKCYKLVEKTEHQNKLDSHKPKQRYQIDRKQIGIPKKKVEKTEHQNKLDSLEPKVGYQIHRKQIDILEKELFELREQVAAYTADNHKGIRADTLVWGPSDFIASFKHAGKIKLADFCDDYLDEGEIEEVTNIVKKLVHLSKVKVFEKSKIAMENAFKKDENFPKAFNLLLKNYFETDLLDETAKAIVDETLSKRGSNVPGKDYLVQFSVLLLKLLAWQQLNFHGRRYQIDWKEIGSTCHVERKGKTTAETVLFPALKRKADNKTLVEQFSDI